MISVKKFGVCSVIFFSGMVFMFMPKCYLRQYIQNKTDDVQTQPVQQVIDEMDFFDEYLFEEDIEVHEDIKMSDEEK